MTKALLIIDMQNDFTEGGALGIDGGVNLGRSISNLDKSEYGLVVATLDWHIDPGEHWVTWPKHCAAGSKGADFVWTLDESQINKTFYKGLYSDGYSGFSGRSDMKNMNEYLLSNHVSEVDVVGLALDYCVKATALDSASLGYRTRVLLDYTLAVSSETGHNAIAELHQEGVRTPVLAYGEE